ncbi:nodal homolog 2-A-like [Pseudophryne corroboree]|uniref:nodal homolog 2-A-like n=1 Tax=Pseudophryne corroboree TaxID=495146 RepID=UPI003081365A
MSPTNVQINGSKAVLKSKGKYPTQEVELKRVLETNKNQGAKRSDEDDNKMNVQPIHIPDNKLKNIFHLGGTISKFLSFSDYIVKNNHWSLTFDLSPILRTEELRLVQLRVHFPTFKKSSNVTLAIYCTMNGQGKLLLGSIMTNMPVKQPSFWKTFNITKMMEQYLHLQSENTLANRADRDTRSIDMPEREDASSHSEYTRNMNHVPLHKIATDQAIIVFFTKDTSLSRTMSPGLIKKLSVSSKRMAEFHRKKKTRHNKQQTTPLITNSTLAEEQKPLCRKVDMLVDFKEIGWDNWVVYPKKYNAYQCVGTCHTPLKEKSKTTNYDYIKSFVKLQDSEQVECSACAPLKMRPLSMLFYENKDLILRHHEYMIVEDCGFN